MNRAEAGRLGGLATVARHGRAHMSEIGARGFASALELGYGALLAELLRPSLRAVAVSIGIGVAWEGLR